MAEAAAPKKLTIFDLQAKVDRGEKVFQVTAVDFPTAQLVDRSGVDCILIGDSLGMTALGYSGTVPVTMDEMIHHAKAISRAAKRAILVGDLPLGAYHASTADAINSAMRMLKEGGTDVVKLEGGEDFAPVVAAVVKSGVPVMAHIGLTPQLVSKLGGFKVQGKSAEAGVQLLKDAFSMEKAGCFAIVLEAVPAPVAARITEALTVPTIGIGAGASCDGQVLVWHDLLGLYEGHAPRFVKQYADLAAAIKQAVGTFVEEVRERRFPEEQHTYAMPEEELALFEEALHDRGEVRERG